MKKSYPILILALLVTIISILPTQAQKRVGYIQSWQSQVTADQASKLTHVIYSFATIHPDLDGKLNPIDGAYISSMVSIAHAQGAKAILAVGGWFPCSYAYQSGACSADGDPEAFNAVAQGVAKTNFVNNLYNLIVQYNLDGLDIDWEYPSASSQGLYIDLLAALRAKLNTHPSKRLELSTAVPASSYRGQYFSSAAFQYLDDIHIMAYDNSPRINHSTYSFAASAIDYWQSRGVANSKLQLGVPFYGWNSSGASMAYKDIVAADPSAPNKIYPNNNTCDQSNGYGYNAKKLIEDKVQLALNENIGGIMIWAIDQDHSSPSNSLLNVIDAKLNNGGGNNNNTGTVTLYQHCSYSGYYKGFSEGNYNLAALQAKGIVNDDVSSIKVNSGYSAILYEHDNFGGASITIEGNDDCLNNNWSGSLNWNDKVSSLKVIKTGGGTGSCPAWAAGTQYYVGDIVTYNGSNYICVNDNPGYDPVISTWFWDPTSQNCDGGNGGGACPIWSAGTQYYTGDIVSYNGSNYICEHDNPGYDPIISTWFWEPTSSGCKSSGFNTFNASKGDQEIYLYPNPLPSGAVLHLDIGSDIDKVTQIEILDVQGRFVKYINIDTSNSKYGSLLLDVSDLKSGSYFIRFSIHQESKTKRLTVL